MIDRGPGVPKPDREAIFERFSRGPAAIGSELPGSGIGLAVVRPLMRAMGGEVAVADAPGSGADFQLRLPIAQADNAALLNVLPSTDIPTASIRESLSRERDGR